MPLTAGVKVGIRKYRMDGRKHGDEIKRSMQKMVVRLFSGHQTLALGVAIFSAVNKYLGPKDNESVSLLTDVTMSETHQHT